LKHITLGALITDKEIENLSLYVASRPKDQRLHACVMEWLGKNPAVLQKFEMNGILPEYGAWMFIYFLNLDAL
jgi:hypothetical protein